MIRCVVFMMVFVSCVGCQESANEPIANLPEETRVPAPIAATDATNAPLADPAAIESPLAFDPSDLEAPILDPPVVEESIGEDQVPPGQPETTPSTVRLEETLRAAKRACEEKEFETAVRLARDALAAAPQRSDLRRVVAEILIRSQQMEEGLALLETLHQQDPDDDKLSLMLVSAYRRKMRESQALADKSQAIRRAANLILQLSDDGRLAGYGKKGEVFLISVLIEAAQTAAADGQVEDAIAALRGLTRTGKVRISDLAKEPVFDAIRATSDFQQVITEYEASGRRRLMAGAQSLMAENKPYRLEFSLLDYRGQRVTSADFPGKVMLVDFWGTWCGPCRMQSPHLARLQRKYADQLAVVGIAYEKVPRSKWARKVGQYVKEHDLPYPCLCWEMIRRSNACQGLRRRSPLWSFWIVERRGSSPASRPLRLRSAGCRRQRPDV